MMMMEMYNDETIEKMVELSEKSHDANVQFATFAVLYTRDKFAKLVGKSEK